MAVDSDGFPQPGHTPYSGAVKKYIKDASRAEAGAIAIEMLGSVGDINASVQRAEDAADRAEDISNIDTSVAAVDFALKEPGPQATLNAAIGDQVADPESPAGVALTATFGVFGIDEDGTYYLTDKAGANGAAVQYDTDGIPYITEIGA